MRERDSVKRKLGRSIGEISRLNKFCHVRNWHHGGIFSRSVTIGRYRFAYSKSRESIKRNDVCIVGESVGNRSQYHGPIQRHLICLSCRGSECAALSYGLYANYSRGIMRVVSCYANPRFIVYSMAACTLYDRINSTPELNDGVPLDKRIRDKDSLRSFLFSPTFSSFYLLTLEFQILSIRFSSR